MATEEQLASVRRAIERRRGRRGEGGSQTPGRDVQTTEQRQQSTEVGQEPQSSVSGVDRSAEEAAVRALASFVERRGDFFEENPKQATSK